MNIPSISVATNAGQTAIETGKVENDEAIPTGFLVSVCVSEMHPATYSVETSATEDYHYTIYYPHADLLSGTGKKKKANLADKIR